MWSGENAAIIGKQQSWHLGGWNQLLWLWCLSSPSPVVPFVLPSELLRFPVAQLSSHTALGVQMYCAYFSGLARRPECWNSPTTWRAEKTMLKAWWYMISNGLSHRGFQRVAHTKSHPARKIRPGKGILNNNLTTIVPHGGGKPPPKKHTTFGGPKSSRRCRLRLCVCERRPNLIRFEKNTKRRTRNATKKQKKRTEINNINDNNNNNNRKFSGHCANEKKWREHCFSKRSQNTNNFL